MRLSSLFSVTFVVGVTAAATFVACGGSSGSNNNVDAKGSGSGSGSGSGTGSGSGSGSGNTNPDVTTGLGQLCPAAQGGGGSACGSADTCIVITGLGSTTTGYCTPNCGTANGSGSNGVCSTGYTGPSGGQEVCALSTGSGSGETGCAIICTSVTQCPGGMKCVSAGSGDPMICVPM